VPEGVVVRRLGPGEVDVVVAASALFDGPADRAATERFLAAPDHHLLMAFDGDLAVGFVSGVETTHPDKGTEMFLYELGVAAAARRRGVASALVEALGALARTRGCYGMFTLADEDNEPAKATYARAGGRQTSRPVMIDWDLDGRS
jgi:ribosomal protein S18 acetylase RimI-like enzyme